MNDEISLLKKQIEILKKQIKDLKKQNNERIEILENEYKDLQNEFKTIKQNVTISKLTPVMIDAREWLLKQEGFVVYASDLRSKFGSLQHPDYWKRFKDMLEKDDNFIYFSGVSRIKSIIIMPKNNPVVMTAVQLYKNTERGKGINPNGIIEEKGKDFAFKVMNYILKLFSNRVIRGMDIWHIKKKY